MNNLTDKKREGMTNQEAIKVLNCSSLQTFCLCKVAIDGKMLSMKEALGMGIEALENQKFVIEELEAIKAEIKDLDLKFFDKDYRAGVARGIMEFNKILNKRISELRGDK